MRGRAPGSLWTAGAGRERGGAGGPVWARPGPGTAKRCGNAVMPGSQRTAGAGRGGDFGISGPACTEPGPGVGCGSGPDPARRSCTPLARIIIFVEILESVVKFGVLFLFIRL